MSTNLIRFLVAVSFVACADASKEPADDTTSTDTTETSDTDTTGTADTTDPADTTDTTDTDGPGPGGVETAEPVDTTEPGLPASDLVGRFMANSPTIACNANIFNQTVVEVTEVDADSVSITDGTVTFTCDISGTDLICPTAVGSTNNIQINQFEWCNWPYLADVEVHNVDVDSFFVNLSFVTSPAVGGEHCPSVLGVCSGQGAASFMRMEETPGLPQVPMKAMVAP